MRRMTFQVDVPQQEINEHDILKALSEQANQAYVDGWAAAEKELNSPIPDDAVCVYLDGEVWCAVRKTFKNLQENRAGFGLSMNDAIAQLLSNEKNNV